MADDLKSVLSTLLRSGGQKRFHFAFGIGKRKDKNGDNELVIATRTHKPVKKNIDAQLDGTHGYFEGLCWSGTGPDNLHTVYFRAKNKPLALSDLTKMIATARHVTGHVHDFQLPSEQEAVRAEQLLDHDGDSHAGTRPPPVSAKLFTERVATLESRIEDIKRVDDKLGERLQKAMDGAKAFAKKPDYVSANTLLDRIDELLHGTQPHAVPDAADLESRLAIIETRDLGLAEHYKSPDLPRMQMLAKAARSLLSKHDYVHAAKVIDELEDLRDKEVHPPTESLPDVLERLRVRVENLVRNNPDCRADLLPLLENAAALVQRGDPAADQAVRALRDAVKDHAYDQKKWLTDAVKHLRSWVERKVGADPNVRPQLVPLLERAEALVRQRDAKAAQAVTDLADTLRQLHAPAPAAVGVDADLEDDFAGLRNAVSLELVRLMGFLPATVLAGLNARFDEAARSFGQQKARAAKGQPVDETAILAAIRGLDNLQKFMEQRAPEFDEIERRAVRTRLSKMLNQDSKNLLSAAQRKEFLKQFQALDLDNPADPAAQRDKLAALEQTVTEATADRYAATVGFVSDFNQARPLVQRAVRLCGQPEVAAWLQDELSALAAADATLTLDYRCARLTALKERVKVILGEHEDEFVALQQQSLPIDAAVLQRGMDKKDILGQGQFGIARRLRGPGDVATGLVGKECKDPTDPRQLRDLKWEEQVYARLGEHPNIAQCHGIHEMDGQPVLVVREIAGNSLNGVCADLEEKLRDGRITRKEYLAGIQHLLRGALQGLAHVEACGLVHKDVKGDNIRFDAKTHEAVLIDMGIAQQQNEKLKGGYFLPNMPAEAALELTAATVTPLWDSFAVGKLLFPLLEQMPDSAQKFQFVAGMPGAVKATLIDGSIMPSAGITKESAALDSDQVVRRETDGSFTARTDATGNLVGQTLRPAQPAGPVLPGEFRALTDYVDFMNRLTHPDPKLRLTPAAALKQPFLTEALTDDVDFTKVFRATKKSASKPAAAASAVPGAPPPDDSAAHQPATEATDDDAETEASSGQPYGGLPTDDADDETGPEGGQHRYANVEAEERKE
jgi:serine/threonine protein kinase